MRYCAIAVGLLLIGWGGAAEVVWNTENFFGGWGEPVRLGLSIAEGKMTLTLTGADSSIGNRRVLLDPKECLIFEIEYRASGFTGSTTGQLFFANAGQLKFVGNQYWRLPRLQCDGKWHVLRLRAATSLAYGLDSWTQCGTIDKLRLDMADQFPGTIEIRSIRFLKDDRAELWTRWPDVKPELPGNIVKKAELDTPYWGGFMLRAAADTPQNIAAGKTRFAFRKVFDAPGALRSALLQIAADDEYEVWLNGRKILSSHVPDGWRSPGRADVLADLKPKDNVLAGVYRNSGGPGGVIAELTMLEENGKAASVVSDATFRAGEMIAGDAFLLASFDDSNWPAMIPQSPPPAVPWNVQLPFLDIVPRPALQIVSCRMPKYGKAGEMLPVELECRGQIPPGPIRLAVKIATGSGVTATAYTCTAANDKIRLSGEGTWVLSLELPLPRHFSGQVMTVSLRSKELKLVPDFCREFQYLPRKSGAGFACRVDSSGDAPRLLVNGAVCYPMIGNCRFRFGESKFSKVPMTFRTFWCRNQEPMWWRGPEQFDFSVIDRYFEELLGDDPDTPVIVFAGTEMPLWWGALHPEELARFSDGSVWRYGLAPASFSSRRFLQDSLAATVRLIEYCRQAPYADRIAGFVLSNGYSAEWQNWGCHDAAARNQLMDYSVPSEKAFAAFAAREYPDIPAAERTLPAQKERLASGNGVFLGEPSLRRKIAANDFLSADIADFICTLARAAKRAAGPDWLIGVYYGYTFEYGNLGWNVNVSGHNALKRVLDSPDIDMILSPPSYGVRNLGDCGGDMKPFASIKAAGKLSIIDDDTRTHLIPFADFFQTVTAKQTESILRRNLGRTLTRMEPLCLYALTGGNEFSSDAVIADLRRFRQAAETALSLPVQSRAEIAVVISERANHILAYEKNKISQEPRQWYGANGTVAVATRMSQRLTGDLTYFQRTQLARIGAPVDYILAEDLARVADRPYKMWIFLNAFQVDDSFRRVVKQLRETSALLLWMYAPGRFFNGFPASPELMTELTGMRFKELPEALEPVVRFDSGRLMGGQGALSPLRAVLPGKGVTPIAQYRDAPDWTAIASVRDGKSTSVFCGINRLEPNFLRELASRAGVRFWTDSDDILHANSHFVSFHVRSAGRKKLNFIEPVDVVDVFERRVLARQVRAFSFNGELHDSFLFYIGAASQFFASGDGN